MAKLFDLWEYECKVSKTAWKHTMGIFKTSPKTTAAVYLVGTAFYLYFANREELAEVILETISFAILPTMVLFVFYRVTVPVQLIKDIEVQKAATDAERLRLENQLKPKLSIVYDEADPNSYHDSPSLHRSHSLEEIFDQTDGVHTLSDWRYCRLKIRNLSKLTTVEDVEVRLADVEPFPDGLRGKLPLPLRFTHDNVPPYKPFKNINPESFEFVDVIKQSWPGHGSPYLVVEHSVQGLEGAFKIGQYRIKIEARGKNANCEPAYFEISMKNKDGTGVKLWLWQP